MLLTFKNETADLDAVFDFLTRQPEIDAKRAGVLGFSQGARVMADFLGRRADRVSAAVSWSGACARGDDDVFEKWRARYYADAVKNGYALLPSTWRDDLMLPKDWFDEIRASRPLESLARYTGALLVGNGGRSGAVGTPPKSPPPPAERTKPSKCSTGRRIFSTRPIPRATCRTTSSI